MTTFDHPPALPLPIMEEVQCDGLSVCGEIPADVRGLYVRNGPNPRSGESAHPFFGDGMLHGVWLADGRAARYANRWVRTPAFVGAASDDPLDIHMSVANTSVVEHAGRILTLEETALPFEVGSDLSTIGAYDFGGRLNTPMTAHPKICPITGEMLFFGAQWSPNLPALTFHRAAADGALVETREIEVPGHTMMHDFAITEKYVIFLDLPVLFDLERAQAGTMPFRWSDSYGARFGLMPRDGTGDVRWFDIAPCYIFHVLNAYDDGDRVVVDAVRYPELWRDGTDKFGAARLHRWSIDTVSGEVRESELDDTAIEFPRINESRTGRPYRFGYATHFDRSEGGGAIVKYDLEGGRSERRDFGRNRTPGEAVFVPTVGAGSEDDGSLMTYVYDATTDKSDFVLLNARDLTVRATVALPQRIPNGFHGAFFNANI